MNEEFKQKTECKTLGGGGFTIPELHLFYFMQKVTPFKASTDTMQTFEQPIIIWPGGTGYHTSHIKVVSKSGLGFTQPISL